MPSPNPCDAAVQLAFEQAIREFKDKIGNSGQYKEILGTTSVDQVYDLTDKLQEDLGKMGRLRNLAKMQPYLKRLQEYTGVIDTFVQAKPDILAFIWGPIKLLVQLASVTMQSLDAIVETTAEIGALLPEFKQVTVLFGQNEHLKNVLVLFFHDILDFYTIALKFFNLTRWRFFFESVWPARRDKIRVIMGHIERHACLMRNEVRLEHINNEHNHRVRALKHFDETEKSQRQQEYRAIETNISPKYYHDRLDWFRGRVCQGTCKWLSRDPIFTKWLEPTGAAVSSRVVWLRGIPGAGKTFLAGTAVEKAISKGRTIYAFLSHNFEASTTALSIFHSLIFQLASTGDDLKLALCQAGRENLQSSLDMAASLLSMLLNGAGSTAIVIDGVDEIDKIEQRRLLCRLLDLAKDCVESRLLISSRNEVGIAEILEAPSSVITVDSRNAGSIQAFVTRRTQEWFLTRSFHSDQQAQIERLLAPIAYKADGMFLYAQLLFDLIENLDDIRDIHMELESLPGNLDAAYARIFKRINGFLSEIDRTRARNILGWVGCSPRPMTVQELSQALEIAASYDTSATMSPATLNVRGLCGPIIEVDEDYVRFVHFTAKEYIFSPKMPDRINVSQACLDLALCCLQYLCRGYHDECYTQEETEAAILAGAYRLYDYAANSWLCLIEHYIRLESTSRLPAKLIYALESFVDLRAQGSADDNDSPTKPLERNQPADLEALNLSEPIRCRLRQATAFRQLCLGSDFCLDNAEKWSSLDPFMTCYVSVSIYRSFRELLCATAKHMNDCPCAGLVVWYGSRLFKCGFLDCPSRHYGFATKTLRDSHSKHHERPWKCSIPDCEYAEIGFLSKRMRQEHLNNGHKPNQGQIPSISVTPSQIDANEVQPLLFDLIASDNVGAVKALRPYISGLSAAVQGALIELAATSGSSDMVEILHKDCHADVGREDDMGSLQYLDLVHPGILKSSIKAKNTEVLRWYLSQSDIVHENPVCGHPEDSCLAWSSLLADILRSDSPEETFQECEQFLAERLVAPFPTPRHRRASAWANIPLALRAMQIQVLAAADDIIRESLLLRIWTTLLKNSNAMVRSQRYLETVLGWLVDSSCSIALAKVLLEHGATPDCRKSDRYLTPLHRTVRRSSPRTAKMARFLLYQGANPNLSGHRSKLKIREEIGAKEISKWLGVSWDELIEQVNEDKKKGVCPPEYLLRPS